MSSLDVSCDGKTVYPESNGHVVTKVWDTGIRVVVPPNQFCWFLPTSEFKQVVLQSLSDQPEEPQPLILTCKKPQVRLRQGRPIGALQFLQALKPATSVILQWEHKE